MRAAGHAGHHWDGNKTVGWVEGQSMASTVAFRCSAAAANYYAIRGRTRSILHPSPENAHKFRLIAIIFCS